MTATGVPQTINLGTTIEMLDLKKIVKEVKLADEVLSPDDYTVTMHSGFDSGLVGNQTTNVDVQTKDGKQSVTVEVPFKVKWGNTVATGSNDNYVNDRKGVTLSLLQGDTPIISANPGISSDNREIHSLFPDETYYSIDLFNASEYTKSLNSEAQGYVHLDAKGSDLKMDKLKEWGVNQQQTANYGDILKVFVAESNKNWLYVDEQQKAFNGTNKEMYYELTKSGFRPLHFNQLVAKEVTLKNGTSPEDVTASLKQALDVTAYENIKIEGFEDDGPDTSVDGTQILNVVVSEEMTTGEKVNYSYPVIYKITPVITEEYYTETGELFDSKVTNLTYGDSYVPEIQDLYEKNETVYEYQGWLNSDGIVGETPVEKGKPGVMKETTVVKYIYQDRKQLIHVSLPTETLFSVTESENKMIKSNAYIIENLSDTAPLQVTLSQFIADENQVIDFLSAADPNPVIETEAIRLNLMIDENKVVESLSNSINNSELGTMEPQSKWKLRYTGEYFGEVEKNKKKTSHSMVVKFKAVNK